MAYFHRFYAGSKQGALAERPSVLSCNGRFDLSLQFHHFFVFVDQGASVVDHLINAGFLEGSRNSHPGQGTANRRLFFSNGMLEFIWVTDVEEIKSPLTSPTRLFERSQYQTSGFSPFGICLCPSPETRDPLKQPFLGWSYRPEYLPSGFEVWEAAQDAFPAEPMIFFLSFVKPYGSASEEKEPIHHLNGVHAIEQIMITMSSSGEAGSEAARRISSIPRVKLKAGDAPSAEIILKSSFERAPLDLTPWCPVRIIFKQLPLNS